MIREHGWPVIDDVLHSVFGTAGSFPIAVGYPDIIYYRY